METTNLIIYGVIAILITLFIFKRFLKNFAGQGELNSNFSQLPFPTEDWVYISDDAKVNAVKKILDQIPDAVLIAWFKDSVKKYSKLLNADVAYGMQFNASMAKGKTVLILERYPLKKRDFDLAERMQPEKIIYISSLDDPLLEMFGSDRIKNILEKMGAQPDEVLTHPMITKSLSNAQEKIQKRMITDPEVNSAEQWFALNKIGKIG
jgi:hypothetical protein